MLSLPLMSPSFVNRSVGRSRRKHQTKFTQRTAFGLSAIYGPREGAKPVFRIGRERLPGTTEDRTRRHTYIIIIINVRAQNGNVARLLQQTILEVEVPCKWSGAASLLCRYYYYYYQRVTADLTRARSNANKI